jgi:exosortase/archaeosortase family protein
MDSKGGRRARPVVWFVAAFVLCVAAFYALTTRPLFTESFFPAYLRINAWLSAAILRAFDPAVRAHEAAIVSPHFSVSIVRGCDAIEPSALFVAAVVALPAPAAAKLAGAVLGTAALLVLNLARIVSLFLVGARWPAVFETVHADVWQALFIVVAITLWIGWALWATGRAAHASARGATG